MQPEKPKQPLDYLSPLSEHKLPLPLDFLKPMTPTGIEGRRTRNFSIYIFIGGVLLAMIALVMCFVEVFAGMGHGGVSGIPSGLLVLVVAFCLILFAIVLFLRGS